RSKHRVMTAMEFMARLSAIIAPPRFPLSRYAGVLAPRSRWRRDIVPKPRDRRGACDEASDGAGVDVAAPSGARARNATQDSRPRGSGVPASTRLPSGAADVASPHRAAIEIIAPPARPGEVVLFSLNIISVRQWDRLLGGLLYAVTPRIDWATLL